jgi:hypothetical protein
METLFVPRVCKHVAGEIMRQRGNFSADYKLPLRAAKLIAAHRSKELSHAHTRTFCTRRSSPHHRALLAVWLRSVVLSLPSKTDQTRVKRDRRFTRVWLI